ncbi:glycosyltransferase family 2 protein [uncultured Gimesia sp.]|uniref:TIGR04283 family arsenosugar biosynthesis glycosyltransferase n=1 Tax=uncultured Gimesia sp. TaxID=1678688 RepID=UPI0026187830|nr:glycosyltransferase family 2 protein [uncultured Gimesia sp.]
MDSGPQISVVIPVLDGECFWKDLIADLAFFPDSAEFLFISNGNQPQEFTELAGQNQIESRSHWYCSSVGRAIQMNLGASEACGSSLLFLHSDSRLSETGIGLLIQSLKLSPGALHYFNLKFPDQSSFLMKLNQWGVYFRSHILGIPFGDQGLCLNRDLFMELGGYNESAAYGEDHLLVWVARRRGVRLKCTGASIETSARKYQQQGWLKITLQHVFLSLFQAVPQLFLLIKDRIAAWYQGKAQSPSL